MSTRRPSAQALTLIGAVALGVSAFLNWFDDLAPSDIATRWLFWDDARTTSDEISSMAVPLLAAAAIALLGALIGSRLLGGLGLLVGLATLVVWVVRQAVVLDDAGLDFEVSDIQPGAWLALGSLVVLAIGVAGLRRRTEESPAVPGFTSGPAPTH